MWLSSLIVFVLLILPVASSISLFSSDQARSGKVDRSESPEVDYFYVLTTALLVTAVVGVVLYLLLFTTFAPVHDAAHQLRHGMAVIPCH